MFTCVLVLLAVVVLHHLQKTTNTHNNNRYFLAPQKQQEGETVDAFAARVQEMIAKQVRRMCVCVHTHMHARHATYTSNVFSTPFPNRPH